MKKRLVLLLSLFVMLFLICSCGDASGTGADGTENKDEEYFETEEKDLMEEGRDEADDLIEKGEDAAEEILPSTTTKNTVDTPSATTTTGGVDTTLPTWNYSEEVELPEDNF